MNKASPKDLILAITYRCNSRCIMCNIWQKQGNGRELKLEDFYKLPENLRDINITGGEPFLRQDLYEIVKIITQSCPKAKIIISTNGFATDLIMDQMKKILVIRPDIGIAVSLDGIGEAHDKIRGIVGGYDKAIATIKGLRTLGIKKLKIGFTMGDYNTQELRRVYGLAKELGAEFTLAVVHSSKNYFNKENRLENRYELLKQLEWLQSEELSSWNWKKWARAFFAYGMQEFIRTGERVLPDYSGELNIFIDPLGDIFPSDVSAKKIGSLGNVPGNFKKENDIDCAKSWMVCTVRPAMKKHWLKVSTWILKNKFKRFQKPED